MYTVRVCVCMHINMCMCVYACMYIPNSSTLCRMRHKINF